MSVVFSHLRRQTLPVEAPRIARYLGWNRERVYTELVQLEAAGLARPIPGYFDSAAGWIATDGDNHEPH